KELHRIEMDPAQFAALAKVLAKRLGTTKRALGAFEYDEGAREESKAINIPPTAAPWEGEVKAAAVLDEVCATLARFVWMKPSHNRAVALWIVLSYLHDVVDILPILLITSPAGFGRYLLESLGHIIQEKRKKENLEPTEKIFFR